jgi:hypothetical protein
VEKSLGKNAPVGAKPFFFGKKPWEKCACWRKAFFLWKTLEMPKQFLRFLNPLGSEKALGKMRFAQSLLSIKALFFCNEIEDSGFRKGWL